LLKSITSGGMAGCVLACRLGEDPNVSVLVLERGHINDTWLARSPLLSQLGMPGHSHFGSELLDHCKNQKVNTILGEIA
jgi:choline dehydrogenase-like flavoprotein